MRYTDKNKNNSRQVIWATFAPMAAYGALLMPAEQGLDLHYALANGFAIENLLFVDDNPGILATFTQGVLIPMLGRKATMLLNKNRRAAPVSEASVWFARHKKFVGAIHLDLMGNFDGDSPAQIARVIQSGLLLPGGLLCVTITAAHDTGRFTCKQDGDKADPVLHLIPSKHKDRILKLQRIVSVSAQQAVPFVAAGYYNNFASKTPMLWGIFKIGE